MEEEEPTKEGGLKRQGWIWPEGEFRTRFGQQSGEEGLGGARVWKWAQARERRQGAQPPRGGVCARTEQADSQRGQRLAGTWAFDVPQASPAPTHGLRVFQSRGADVTRCEQHFAAPMIRTSRDTNTSKGLRGRAHQDELS